MLVVMADQLAHLRRLLRARDAMDRDFAHPLDVASLASIACISESNFIRSFKAAFGETPHRYLQRRRIERAMFLLRTTDASVTDVCMRCGFSSLGTFSRTFSDIIGESPSAFRARGATSERSLRLPPGPSGTEKESDPLPEAGPVGALPSAAFVPTCFVRTWTRPADTVTVHNAAPKPSSFGEAAPAPNPVR